jgi:hypothetical protein
MGPNEKLGRSIMNMIDAIKDAVSAKISEAVSSGQIRIDPASLANLNALVAGTIDSGYHQAARIFDREVSAAFAASSHAPETKKKA